MPRIPLLAVTLLVTALPLSSQELATPDQRQTLADLCFQLAKTGRGPVLREVYRCLTNLGMDRSELDALQQRCRKELARRRRPIAVSKRTIAGVKALARELAERLPKLGDDARADLAFEILALDAGVAAAHKALGRTLVDGQWIDEDEVARRKRRVEIRAAIREANELEIPITVREYTHPVHELLGIDWGLELKYQKIRFVTHLPRERSERIFRQALRAAALFEWLISGRLMVHRATYNGTWVLVEPEEDYEATIDAAVKARGFEAELAGDAKRWAEYYDKRGWNVQCLDSDLYSQAVLLADFCESRTMPPFLMAGLCNWTSETMLGHKMPDIVVFETDKDRPTVTAQTRKTTRVDPATYRKAGTYGGREWMKWLVSSGSAPGMPACFVDEIGKLRGKELVKCTLVAEHWIETGPLLRLLRRLNRGKGKSGFAFVKVFESATDLEIAEFEEDWQRWLMGPERCLVERITPEPNAKLDPGAQEALAYLGQLRKRAFAAEHMQKFYDSDSLIRQAEVQYHGDLSAQARRLADHLAEKAAKTDTTDEPQPDLDSLRASGSWRVFPALIDYAATDPERTVDFWMGSLYQRATLLDPGLLGIGYAKSGVIAVADAGSLVNEAEGFWAITWPVDGARRVPVRHSELTPKPVPSVEPDSLGYPVTLHLGPDVITGKGFHVELELHRGSQSGPLVECWLSSPSKPTNPRWAPRRVWGLLPKAPLLKGKTYHARAVIHGAETWTLWWKFRT